MNLDAALRPSQADKIEAILKAAKITVEPYWPSLFAKVLAKKDIGDLITNVGAGAPVAVAAGAPAGAWLPPQLLCRRARPWGAMPRSGVLCRGHGARVFPR